MRLWHQTRPIAGPYRKHARCVTMQTAGRTLGLLHHQCSCQKISSNDVGGERIAGQVAQELVFLEVQAEGFDLLTLNALQRHHCQAACQSGLAVVKEDVLHAGCYTREVA